MMIVGIRKSLIFSIRFCWISIFRHPFVAGFLFFVLVLYKYFPSLFGFLVYCSPVIACTAFLLGALLVYGEPVIHEPEDVKNVNVPVKVRSVEGDTLKKGKKEKTSKVEEVHDVEFMEKEVFSIENSAEGTLQSSESLKVEIKKPFDNQFESSLGSPWQQVDRPDDSSDSEADESNGGESSSSSDNSMTDVVPIIDELHPLLESENLQPAHIDASDAVLRASSPEREFDDDGSEGEETENQADEEDEEVQEEKDSDESVVKWNADDQKNLMDLGNSELERNQRLENLIAKRRARKLQRFQTDKNLIDLDAESLLFTGEISRLSVQIPAISAPKRNPFDLPFDFEKNMGLPPIPGSAPSVLHPRGNPFDLPYDQNEERSKIMGESSRPYDVPILPRIIDTLNLEAVSDDAGLEKDEPKLKPYFVAEKMSGTNFASFERQLSEVSDSEDSSSSESNLGSAVVDQDDDLLDHEMHEQASSMNEDVEFNERESNSSLIVNLGEADSISPVSSTVNLEVIDERYDGSSSSSCFEEDDKCDEAYIQMELMNSAYTEGNSVISFGPKPSVVKPHLLRVKGAEKMDDTKVTDPVYDSSPTTMPVSLTISLEEALSSKLKGEGVSTGSSSASHVQENLLEVSRAPMTFMKGEYSEEREFIRVTENMSSSPSDDFRVESGPKNAVENVKYDRNEASDEVYAKLREIKSVNEVFDSGVNVVENFHEKGYDRHSNIALEADAGSSFDGNSEMNATKLNLPEPSVVSTNDSGRQLYGEFSHMEGKLML